MSNFAETHPSSGASLRRAAAALLLATIPLLVPISAWSKGPVSKPVPDCPTDAASGAPAAPTDASGACAGPADPRHPGPELTPDEAAAGSTMPNGTAMPADDVASGTPGNDLALLLLGGGWVTSPGAVVALVLGAVLAAISVPVFLGQKEKALSSQAKQNVKHVADTIESCAAGTTSGDIIEGTINCATTAEVARQEGSLRAVLAPSCGKLSAGKVCVRSLGASAYELRGAEASGATTPNSGDVTTTTYTYHRTATDVKKTCTPVGPVCATGTW